MTWLRLYTSIINDPKVQQLPDRCFKAWVNLLCIAKENDGYLADIQTISFQLRLQIDEVSQLIESLIEYGLLDKSKRGVSPHNWNHRQYVSDVSTLRVKRFRKRQRNVSETLPEQSRADTDTDSTPKGALLSVLDDEHTKAIIAHRQKLRNALTPHAASLLAKQLAKCPDPNAAADEMILRGWKSIKPDWLQSNGRDPPKKLNGGRLPDFKPEKPMKPISEEERQANLAKLHSLAKIRTA
jgi:hypothetical protein